jgi:hypothetical protein
MTKFVVKASLYTERDENLSMFNGRVGMQTNNPFCHWPITHTHTHTHTPDQSNFCYNLLWAGFPMCKWEEELWRTSLMIIHIAQLSSIDLIAENPKVCTYICMSVSQGLDDKSMRDECYRGIIWRRTLLLSVPERISKTCNLTDVSPNINIMCRVAMFYLVFRCMCLHYLWRTSNTLVIWTCPNCCLENRPAGRPIPLEWGLCTPKQKRKEKKWKRKRKRKKKYLTSCQLCFRSKAVYDAEWSPVDRL